MSITKNLRSEQRWRDIIKDCQESGQSIRSYCLRRGISEGAFHYWRKKLHRQLEPKLHSSPTPTFVPVRLLNQTSFRIKAKQSGALFTRIKILARKTTG